jgi:BlaI family transcriptional regulator, penicillinase repressor
MARLPSENLTDREAQLMEILWRDGAQSAEAVRLALDDQPHDSTVRTLLRILAQKGYVRIRGRQPALYEAAIARSRVQAKATRNLLTRFFAGSVTDLVQQLVEDKQLSPEELDRIGKSFKARRRKGG